MLTNFSETNTYLQASIETIVGCLFDGAKTVTIDSVVQRFSIVSIGYHWKYLYTGSMCCRWSRPVLLANCRMCMWDDCDFVWMHHSDRHECLLRWDDAWAMYFDLYLWAVANRQHFPNGHVHQKNRPHGSNCSLGISKPFENTEIELVFFGRIAMCSTKTDTHRLLCIVRRIVVGYIWICVNVNIVWC